jgi:SOS-response transcriptional repressor LexA
MSDRNQSKISESNHGQNPVGLTARQAQVADAIVAFIEKNGYAPTFSQIGEAVGITGRPAIQRHVDLLCGYELFTKQDRETRTLVRTARPYFVKEQVTA